jgi:glycosyltransferase involved in cell wall biosynthesis
VDVIAMSDKPGYAYPDIVRREISQQDATAYKRAADFLNEGSYDVLSVQHEYGIFGGDSGRLLLGLLREVRMPVVTTLHTVLKEPSPGQRAVLSEILDLSARVIVMSGRAVEILESEYDLDVEKIDLVPHGIPDFSPAAGRVLRELLEIRGPMLLTFGLLSPGNGIEYVLRAMPAIIAQNPGAVYIVLGATHPQILSQSGELYRNGLQDLASSLGVADNVRFVNQFVTTKELTAYLGAADIYVSPYLAPDQITSGTLAYAVGAGKRVIATPYPYAQELLASGRGVLVPFKDSQAIARAVNRIQQHPDESREMALRAAVYGVTMQWQEVGRRTMATFTLAAGQNISWDFPEISLRVRSKIPPLEFHHLLALTDDTGIYQHATFTLPSFTEGYCVDDNARALIFTAYLEHGAPLSPEMARAQSRYLAFVYNAFNPVTGRFRNFMSFGRSWLEDSGSEDSHGRSLWALAIAAGRCRHEGYRRAALQAFEWGCPAVAATTSPRTWAHALIAANEVLRVDVGNAHATALRRLTSERLVNQLDSYSKPDWPWFEETLSYGNAKLCQALITTGQAIGSQSMLEAGVKSLSWLAGRQTADSGLFSPIGSHNYSFDPNNPLPIQNAIFDQQPLEAWDSVSAYLAAAAATADPTWLKEADRAYGWFLGDNVLGVPLYDPFSGGCRDALHEDRPNENQGAESTLAFLCASLEMRQMAPIRADSNPAEAVTPSFLQSNIL